MNNCILCGQLTDGSIGAAGLVWNNICQPCKNEEDAKLAFNVKSSNRGMKMILSSLGLGELGSEIPTPQSDVDTLTKEEKMSQFLTLETPESTDSGSPE